VLDRRSTPSALFPGRQFFILQSQRPIPGWFKMKNPNAPAVKREADENRGHERKARLARMHDVMAAHVASGRMPGLAHDDESVTVSLSGPAIDARFLGLLLMLKKQLKNTGAAPIFVGVSPGLERIFRLNSLDFMYSNDVLSPQDLGRKRLFADRQVPA
jgi:hypothetical protein